MATAEEIKKARATLGESQETFGKRFGVDQSTVHRWETVAPPKRGPARRAVEGLLAETASNTQAAE